ncbi:MAG TPA: tail fiber protein [Janthinobacterium sp.]|nr:tail fiber protein [Janthinobacterium sp.]
MAEGFLGEVRLVAFNFAPPGWLMCEGQTLPIAQFNALFALIGTTYGGNGVNNFVLPDLRGRAAIHSGQGPLGNYTWGTQGGTGANTVNTAAAFTLTADNLPSHTHSATFTGIGGGPAVQPTIAISVSNDAAIATPTGAPPGATPIANGYLGKSTLSIPQQPAIYTATTTNGTTKLNDLTAVASGGSGGGITGGTVTVGNTGTGTPVTAPLNFNVPAAMPPFLAMNYMICTAGIFPSRP